VVVAVVGWGCSGDGSTGPSADSNRSHAAQGAHAVVCSGANEVNQDDDGAVQALLVRSQLPPASWTTSEMSACPWALSADELLAVPECRTAAAAANAPATRETRNGNGRVTFTRADGVQLDDRVEIYTSRQNVDAIRAILAGPSIQACFAAAMQARAAREPGTTVRDVEATRFAVQPDAADLDLGFPAVAGYAADAGFVDGVDITFTRTMKGKRAPITSRVITFGSGGLMETMTLIGASRAELDAIDLTETLQAAAKNFRAITGS
jgi:hypothetical protein